MAKSVTYSDNKAPTSKLCDNPDVVCKILNFLSKWEFLLLQILIISVVHEDNNCLVIVNGSCFLPKKMKQIQYVKKATYVYHSVILVSENCFLL